MSLEWFWPSGFEGFRRFLAILGDSAFDPQFGQIFEMLINHAFPVVGKYEVGAVLEDPKMGKLF